MQSKISLVNREFMKQISRSIGWISISYFLVLLFTVPFELLITETNEYRSFWPIDSLFQFNQELQVILHIVVPVLLALFLFRFLHVKESSDLFHSLPIKRERIFHQYTLAGLIFLIVPVLLIVGIVWIQHIFWNLEPYFSVGTIFYWAVVTIILNTIVYMSTVFIGMLTGVSIVQGILAYIFLLLPVGLIVLLAQNLNFYLYGFATEYYLNNNIGFFSPLVILDNLMFADAAALIPWLCVYAFLSVILYGFALFLYKKRRLEAVSQSLVFPILRPIFRFGVTFCMALLAALFFGEAQEASFFWLIFGYVSGSILGYLLAEIVLQKTWRVFGNLKNYVYYAGVLIIVVVMMQVDIIGFENRIPKLEEVKQVYLGTSSYDYKSNEAAEKPMYLTQPENIKLAHQLHEEIIKGKKDYQNPNELNESIFMVYKLENGKKLVRQYMVNADEYRQNLVSLYESNEYKEATNQIFQLADDTVETITLETFSMVNRRIVISDPVQLQEAIALLKEDIYAMTFDEKRRESQLGSHVTIVTADRNMINLSLKQTYDKFIHWLDEKGLTEAAMVTANDFSRVRIVKVEDLGLDIKNGVNYEEVAEKVDQASHALEITEKEQIEVMLKLSNDWYYRNQDAQYVVGFYLSNEKKPTLFSVNTSNTPDFIKQFFE